MKRPINYLLMLILAAFTLVACQTEVVEPTPEPAVEEPEPVVELPTGLLEGVVRDAVSSDPLAGALVEVFNGTESLASATTDAAGVYALECIVGEGFMLRVSLDGFIAVEMNNITVTEDVLTHLEGVAQIANELSGPGTMSGMVVDAFNGNAMEQVTLNVRSGMNSFAGDIVATSSTDASGMYSFPDLAAGVYTIEAILDGYHSRTITAICIGGQVYEEQNLPISPILAAGETRVILKWGENPRDLDSHLTGPTETEGERFHVYYSNKTPEGAGANLDLDDVTSYGPETVTITEAREGVYRYSVHNFTDRSASESTSLAESGCNVHVYNDAGLIAEFFVPNRPGTLWTVFEMENGEMNIINEMSYESSSSSVRSSRSDAALMQRLPMK